MKFKNILICGVFCSFLVLPEQATAIVNGVEVDVAEFPIMAALGYDSDDSDNVSPYEYKCGGTLISESWVLTAAHCVSQRSKRPTIVRLGRTSLDLTNSEDPDIAQDIKISTVIVHSNYSQAKKENDIALLKLERPAQFKHNVLPAFLPVHTKGTKKNLTIIGFGVSDKQNRKISSWLRKAQVDELTHESCLEAFREITRVKPTTSQICAKNFETAEDTCQGDAGGPMTYKHNNRHYVYGISSYGMDCGSEFPSVYTRVDKYVDWINEHIQ